MKKSPLAGNPLILVTWVDACHHESESGTPEQILDDVELEELQTPGYFLGLMEVDGKPHLFMATDFGPREKRPWFRGRHSIPLSLVQRVELLQPSRVAWKYEQQK